MFISVHIIALEITQFGKLMLEAMLKSLEAFPDEIVFIDNGCSNEVVEMVDDLVEGSSIILKYRKHEGDFSELRQIALELTNPKTDYCMLVDTDEIFYENNLATVKKKLLKYPVGTSSYGYFKHFVQSPTYIQEILKRDNIFSYSKDIFWENGVHEKLPVFDKAIDNGSIWMHCGYLRSVIATAIKWIHYDILEFGHADRYKKDSLMVGLGIDQILSDRKGLYNIYDGVYPKYFYPILRQYEESDSLNWQHWVTYAVDPRYGQLMDELNDIAQNHGWETVIDYIVDKALWNNY